MSCYGVNYSSGSDMDVDLKDLQLKHDSCGFYLTATYMIEDANSVRKLEIPKIRLKVNPGCVRLSVDTEPFCDRIADIGFGWCELYHTGTREHIYFTETVIEEKVHEMTMDEIEKKLGHKVKIVNKKG